MPEWRSEVEKRLRGARLDGASERDIVDELAQHLEDRYEELRGRGISEAEAGAQALAELDQDGALALRLRRAVTPRPEPLPIGRPAKGDLLAGWWSDLRFGARMLARSPLYTAVAVLVIGLGIGANTVIFTALNTALLRPPSGVLAPDRLAAVFTSDYSGPRFGGSSFPDYEAIRDDLGVFEGVEAHTAQTISVIGDGWTWRGLVEIVSANYFDVLGVAPAAGRFFGAEENDPSRPSAVAVISDDLWNERFGRAASAIGATVRLKGEPFTVIGVAPREFAGSIRPLRGQLWVPMTGPRTVTAEDLSQRGNRGLSIIGRMREGVDVETVQTRLDVVASRLFRAYPDEWTDVNDQPRVFTALPEAQVRVPRQARGPVLGMMALVMGAVFTVLLIACTNVANLMLSRSSTRRTEMGIRLALGATRARIVRHLLAESLLLATLGGTAGVLLAVWIVMTFKSGVAFSIAATLDFAIDYRVLGFAALITLLTGILFGLAPALQTSRALTPMIKEDVSGRARLRMRHALVVFQVASSLVLLVAGGLFIRSLQAAQGMDSGFEVEDVILTRFDLGPEGYTEEQSAAFNTDLLERAVGLPGVTSAALAESVPLSMGWSRRSVSIEGYEPEPGEDMEMMFNGVTPGYFATMGIEPRLGRVFTEADRDGAPQVAIVTEAFARRFWPGEVPIGKHIGFDRQSQPVEVVGMVPDAKYRSLVEDPQPYFYYPHAQRPAAFMVLLVRTAAETEVVTEAIRSAVQDLAPALPPPTVVTFRGHMATAALPQRIAAALLSALGLLAIAIALVGLYGLVAFNVAQRAREFGIRMALGAVAGDVRRLVVGGALRLVLIGIACGVPIAALVAFLVRSFLVVQPIDPVAFIGVPLLLGACALVASYAPARRATRQDPVAALRAE